MLKKSKYSQVNLDYGAIGLIAYKTDLLHMRIFKLAI
jgi:hypothetical protein